MGGLSGHLRLVTALGEDGATTIVEQSFRSPFHMSKPHRDGVVLHVQVVNPTAGMLEGDRLETDIEVRAGASLLLTTPSQARAFRAAGTGGVTNGQRLRVAAGGWLDWWPEPLVPHAGCDYRQETVVEVAAGGSLFFCESIGPGRVARGEAWAWRRLELGLTVSLGERPIARERFALSGAEAAGLAAFAGHDTAWTATCVVIGANEGGCAEGWEKIRRLHAPPVWVGVSRLPAAGAWSLRVIAPDGQQLRDVLVMARQILADWLPGLGVALRRV
jgi:urease accessory protein